MEHSYRLGLRLGWKKYFAFSLIFAVSLSSLLLFGTESGFLDSEPLLRKQKVDSEYTYPIALNINGDIKNYPEVFETGDFTEVRLFYFQNANHINPTLEHHLLLSDKNYRSSFSITKYDDRNAIKMIDASDNTVKVHRFPHREVWMYVQFSEVSKLMVVYMDSEKDGFIYDCKDRDGKIDRVGIYYPEGLVTYNPQYLEEVPLSDYSRSILVNSKDYRANLIRGIRRLLREGKSFQPYRKTSIKVGCGKEDPYNVASTLHLIRPQLVQRDASKHPQVMNRFSMTDREKAWWAAPIDYERFHTTAFYKAIRDEVDLNPLDRLIVDVPDFYE